MNMNKNQWGNASPTTLDDAVFRCGLRVEPQEDGSFAIFDPNGLADTQEGISPDRLEQALQVAIAQSDSHWLTQSRRRMKD